MRKWVWLLGCFAWLGFGAPINLEGVPLELTWCDVNGDGHLDLLALMLVTQTEGQVDTFFEDGKLRGFYEDHTFKEKYLTTWINEKGAYQEAHRIPLGTETVLGFVADSGAPGQLILWTRRNLTRHHWSDQGWQAGLPIPTPGLLAAEAVHMSAFAFWQPSRWGPAWIVPDLDGLRLVFPEQRDRDTFLPYPDFSFDRNYVTKQQHQVKMAMPILFSLDADSFPELIFHGDGQFQAWRLGDVDPAYQGSGKGRLIDINGDGLADLVQTEEMGEIEKLKDLPKVKTRVMTFLAREPLRFGEEPDGDQAVPGFVLTENDSDIELAEPFLDINGDGLPDLAGVAFKISVFQIAKLVATGRFKLKFHLHLSLQDKTGRFLPLPGGPFEMVWKINIRRLRLPEFAQMTADFDGDGWIDILMENGARLQVTPVDASGYQSKRKWTRKIPGPLRDPDQVYGKDLNGDGRADFVLVKVQGKQTRIAILEGGR